MSFPVYVLQRPINAQRPSRWDIHTRYALRLPDETLTLPAGTWLLALPASEEDGRSQLPHYRLPDGRVVALAAPLTDDQAIPLTDPQALSALNAYRPLEQTLLEDWGLWVEHVDHNPPFRLIQCPLCGGIDFTTVAFAEVWCDGCQAQFHIRHTAGDPGFVVDCAWRHYRYQTANYLIPRSDNLLMTMVFKNSGDPLDLTHDRHCHREDCTAEQTALTDGRGGTLRAGLHACALGDVYDWSFYGRVPTVYQRDSHGSYDLVWPDGHKELWPGMAFVSVSGLTWEERQGLEGAAAQLEQHAPDGRYRDDLVAHLKLLAERPSRAPYLPSRSPWPHPENLAEGEKYLLHHWLLKPDAPHGLTTATPVWLVVSDVSEDKYSPRWQVVRDNICIACGRPVTSDEVAMKVNQKRPWETPHGHCRELWQQHDWQPSIFPEAGQLQELVGEISEPEA